MIVALDSIDATVVLLDDIISPDTVDAPEEHQEVIIPSHNLIMLNRVCVLPAEFAEDMEATHLH